MSCQGVQEDFSGIAGKKAPDFTLFSTEGEQVHLLDYKDKVIVLFFWGVVAQTVKLKLHYWKIY